MVSMHIGSGYSIQLYHAWTKCITLGITKELRLEGLFGGDLVQSPLLKQGEVVRSSQVICKLNNAITYGELNMQLD